MHPDACGGCTSHGAQKVMAAMISACPLVAFKSPKDMARRSTKAIWIFVGNSFPPACKVVTMWWRSAWSIFLMSAPDKRTASRKSLKCFFKRQ